MSTITFLFSTGQVVAHCYYVYRTFAINNFLWVYDIHEIAIEHIERGNFDISRVCCFMARSSRWKHIFELHLGLSYIHTRQPTNPRPMPTNFYGLVGYDRVKKITSSDWRAYLSPINTRCILAVSLMHPRSNPALPDLPPSFWQTNPRSARPTPTYSWHNLRSI